MTDYEIELLATSVAQKVASILMPPHATVSVEPTAVPVPQTWEQMMADAPNHPAPVHKKRGWPKGKPRK